MASSDQERSDRGRTDFGFVYETASSWPPLAWLAICEPGSKSIHLIHGGGVECREQWFCEAVWDSTFSEGGFDRTDLVFGSGGRLREREAIFVSAGSTVDRLQWAIHDNRHTRHFRIFRAPDSQGLHVEVAPAEQRRHAVQHARPVFD